MNPFAVIFIELKQSFLYWLFLTLICFLTGFSLSSAQKSLNRVLDLVHVEDWQADLVILPKGKSLDDFRKELITGKTEKYIPETLYQTTLELSEKQFDLQGVFPLQGSTGVLVLTQGPRIGTNWLSPTTHFTDWQEELIPSSHPVWQKKLLAGIFAKGDLLQMQKLKDLIDQRTVAQAFFIQDEQEKMRTMSDDIKKQIYTFITVLTGLIVVGVFLIFLLLKDRLRQIIFIFKENGLSGLTGLTWKVVVILVLLTIIIPTALGFTLSQWVFLV